MALNSLIADDALRGIKILEFAAIGPVPWGTSIMAQLGAEITRVCRLNKKDEPQSNNFADIKRNDVFIDLKSSAGLEQVKQLISQHDVLIEGMRPGVMERLGLSPEICFKLNPNLVFARVTGWGQDGPLAKRAGHDINYISLVGALHAIGPEKGPPVIPLNLVGDYGGGGAFMVIGILSALLKVKSGGAGSVIDIAMIDGAAKQMTLAYERLNVGIWRDNRASNTLDGGAPWYSVYETSCGGYMAVGAVEPQFYQLLLDGLGLSAVPDRTDPNNWHQIRSLFEKAFLSQSRDYWTNVFSDLDACVSPVLSMRESVLHPHNQYRSTFAEVDVDQYMPGIAPRIYKNN